MYRKILFVFITVFGLTALHAQNKVIQDSLINEGIMQIYRLEFEEAEKTFAKVSRNEPGNPAGKFFDAMIVWWQIMLDYDNESRDDIFKDKLEAVIDMCDDILDKDENNVDALFFKGGALGFRGKLYSIRESWFNAAMDGKDALPLVHEAYALAPENDDVQLGFGIYNYYAEVIPDKYPVVKPFMIFFPDGDREKGLEQLEQAAKSGRYSKYEARYFLLTSYYMFEDNLEKAEKYAEMLLADFPDNPVFEKYRGRINVKRGDWKKAGEVFRDMYSKGVEGKRGYSTWMQREAAYYVAMDYRNRDKPDSALTYFKIVEDLSSSLGKHDGKDSGFLVNSVLYQAMLQDSLGKKNLAKTLYKRVLDYDEYKDSHDTAERYLKRLK